MYVPRQFHVNTNNNKNNNHNIEGQHVHVTNIDLTMATEVYIIIRALRCGMGMRLC